MAVVPMDKLVPFKEYESGMKRENKAGKMRPDLLFPEQMPHFSTIGYDLIHLVADERGCNYRFVLDHILSRDFELAYETLLEVEGHSLPIRFAQHLGDGAYEHGDRNWEKASGQEEKDGAWQSLLRHTFQWVCGEQDEDHAAAMLFNMQLIELIKFKGEGE